MVEENGMDGSAFGGRPGKCVAEHLVENVHEELVEGIGDPSCGNTGSIQLVASLCSGFDAATTDALRIWRNAVFNLILINKKTRPIRWKT